MATPKHPTLSDPRLRSEIPAKASKTKPTLDLPASVENLKKYSANTIAIHEAIKIGFKLEDRQQLASGNLFDDYKKLHGLLNKTFVVDDNKHLTLAEYLELLRAKQILIKNKIIAMRVEQLDEAYIQELESYATHLEGYIKFIDQLNSSLLNKLQQLKKLFIQDALLSEALQEKINANPGMLPDAPENLLAKLNKFNDAVFDETAIRKEVLDDANLKLTPAEKVRYKQNFEFIAILDNSKKTQSSVEDSAYDDMPVEEAKYSLYKVQFHRDACELRKIHNYLKPFKSLSEWKQEFSKLELAHKKVQALYELIQKNSGQYSEYDKSRIKDLKNIFDSYHKENAKKVKSALTVLAEKIIANKSTVTGANERIVILRHEIEELKRNVKEWEADTDKLAEMRYSFVNEINKKKLEMLQLIILLRAVNEYKKIDQQQITYLKPSADETVLFDEATEIASEIEVQNDGDKSLGFEEELSVLSNLYHQITRENSDAKLLYGLSPNQKIHFDEKQGLVAQERLNSLMSISHSSEASLKAFNYYLNMIHNTVNRHQPDFDLFVKLVTSTWGRKILKNAENTEHNHVIWQRVNNINYDILDLYATNALAAESKLFKKIPIERLFIGAEKRDAILDAGVAAITNYNIALTNQVITHLLQQQTPEALAFVVEHYIWLAQQCRKNGAYNSMMAIVAGVSWSEKLLNGIEHCLSDEAKKYLREFGDLKITRNGKLKAEIESRQDAVPYMPCFTAALEAFGANDDASGSSQAKQLKANLMSLFQEQQANLQSHGITLAAFNLLLLDQKPVENYSDMNRQVNSLMEHGIVSATPVMSDIRLSPEKNNRQNIDVPILEEYYDEDARLEKHRIIELNQKMTELYGEIAKINVAINEKTKAIAVFLSNSKDTTFASVTGELSLEIEMGDLDRYIDRYAKHKAMLIEIKLLAQNYENLLAKMKASSAYQRIIVYKQVHYKENSALYNQFIKSWRNMLVNGHANAVDIPADAVHQLVSEKQNKILKLDQSFHKLEEAISYLSQIKNARKIQKELEEEFMILMANNVESVEKLKAIASLRNQMNYIVIENVPPALEGIKGVQEFIRKRHALNKQLEILALINPGTDFEKNNLLNISKERLEEDKEKVIEHEKGISQSIERFVYVSNPILYKYLWLAVQKGHDIPLEKERKLSELDLLLNASKSTKDEVESAVADVFGFHIFFMNDFLQEYQVYEQNSKKTAEHQYKHFLQNFTADRNSILALHRSFEDKKLAFLNFAAKINLNLIRFVAELELNNKPAENLYHEFCASYPEPSATEQRKFKELLHLREMISEKIHLLQVYVEIESNDNKYKFEKLRVVEELKNLYEVNSAQLTSLIETDNPIAIKQFLEHQNIIDQSQVDAEEHRRAQLRNIVNPILQQNFMRKPGIFLSDSHVEQLNTLIRHPAVNAIAMNNLLRELPGKLSLSVDVFNQIRHQVVAQELELSQEKINVNDLLENLEAAEEKLKPLVVKLAEIQFKSKFNALAYLEERLTHNGKHELLSDVNSLIQSFDINLFREFEQYRSQYFKLKAIYKGMSRENESAILENVDKDELERIVDRCTHIFNQYEKAANSYKKWLQKWVNFLEEQHALHDENYNAIKDKLDGDGMLSSAEKRQLIIYQRQLQGFINIVNKISLPENIERYCRMVGIDFSLTQKISQYKRDLPVWHSHYVSALNAEKAANELDVDQTMIKGLHIRCQSLDPSIETHDKDVQMNAETQELSFTPAKSLSYQQKKKIVLNMVNLLVENAGGEKDKKFFLRGDEQLCQKAAILLYSRGFTNIYIGEDEKKFTPFDKRHVDKIPQLVQKTWENMLKSEVETEGRLDGTKVYTLV